MSGYSAETYDCNGHTYTRVSSILGILDKGYGLDKWKSNTIKSKLSDDYYKLLSKGHEIDIDLLADAALRHPNTVRDTRGAQGTKIHDALEALLDPKKDHTPFKAEYPILYENAQQWILESKLEMIKDEDGNVLVEKRLCSHEYEYGGTVDLIAYQEYQGRKQVVIVDFKTGSSVYDTSTLQLAAYANAWEEMHDDTPDMWPELCYIMHVNRDTYKFSEKKHIHRYNIKTKEFEIDAAFNAFKAVREAYRWRHHK
jgi:PD-(D/E)XK nuclease superfamily